jgi:hypothetical protein
MFTAFLVLAQWEEGKGCKLLNIFYPEILVIMNATQVLKSVISGVVFFVVFVFPTKSA